MFSKRFTVALALLTLGLLALVSSVNLALDRLTQSPEQNSFVIYDSQNRTLYAYDGNFSGNTLSLHPAPIILGPRVLHRT